jgi:hypothetical protein
MNKEIEGCVDKLADMGVYLTGRDVANISIMKEVKGTIVFVEFDDIHEEFLVWAVNGDTMNGQDIHTPFCMCDNRANAHLIAELLIHHLSK